MTDAIRRLPADIVLCLCMPEFIVFAAFLGNQRVMASGLYDFSAVEYGYFVAEAAGGQTVADINGGFISGDFVEFAVDLVFRDGIQRGGWFIQNQEGRILVKSSCKGDFLTFSAGNLHTAAIKALVKVASCAGRHGGQAFSETSLPETPDSLFVIILWSGGHILSQTEAKEAEILEDDGEDGHIFVIIVFFDINPIQQDFSLRGVIQTAHQLDEGSLSTAVYPHYRQLFPDSEFQIYMTESIIFGIWEKTIRARIVSDGA